MIYELTERERQLLQAAAINYVADIRRACLEDQGTREGKPGTVGHDLQAEYRELLPKLKQTA